MVKGSVVSGEEEPVPPTEPDPVVAVGGAKPCNPGGVDLDG